MKKIIALLLVIAMTAAASVGLTMAYLTDRDSEANVFTVGNVEIDLEEDFEQGAELIPGVDIEKKPTITNTGDNDAWVWATIAIPAVLDEANDASKNIVHFNYNGDYVNETQWTWQDAEGNWLVEENVEINGEKYNLYTVLYQTALKPGETTPEVMTKVYMDPHVDIDPDGNLNWVEDGNTTPVDWNINENGNPVIYVSAYAIQKSGFATVQDAYEAYQTQWGDNGTEYADPVDPDAPEWDTWDGTYDTSWYNDTDTTFTLTTAEQLAGLGTLVDGGNSFAGKTVKMGINMDMNAVDADNNPITFDPIGDKSAFAGTFDGQGREIANLYQSGWDLGYQWGTYGSIGLFGELNGATVKNLTVSGAECLVEGGDIGGITGSASGNCTFENITIDSSVFATYNNGLGGIIGWSGAGNYTFKNVTIGENVTLAGLWGSFDSSIGGVVGQGEPGASYDFDNVDIACRLDVYNDCTASYDYYNYRMCGMIIGRLEKTTKIDGTNYPDMSQYNITCNNVTVTYGDWANYHYCDPTPGYNGGRGLRVESGYSYDGIPADYDHSQCTNHCNALIAFDQIFGGAQYGVTGLTAYDGVTVIYNNK